MMLQKGLQNYTKFATTPLKMLKKDRHIFTEYHPLAWKNQSGNYDDVDDADYVKCPKHPFLLLGGVFSPFSSFQHDIFLSYGIIPKTPIFGSTWTWIDTWMVHKNA